MPAPVSHALTRAIASANGMAVGQMPAASGAPDREGMLETCANRPKCARMEIVKAAPNSF